jgi:hypothetical protein
VSGAQLIKAVVDGVTSTGTITYGAPAVSAARNISVFPATDATVALEAGDLKNLRFIVVDAYGNGVPGVTVNFNNAGAGFFFGGTNSASAITNTDGIASVAVTSLASSYGASTVTASYAGTRCGEAIGTPAGTTIAANCSTTATIQWSPLPTIGGTTVRTGTGSVTITGVVAPGVTVALMQGAVQVATTTSNATTGVYTFTRTINKTTTYTVKSGGLSSSAFKVTVRFAAKLTLGVSKAHNVLGRVAIGPKVSNISVRYYGKWSGRWHYLGTAKTDSTGVARKWFDTTAGRTYVLAARAMGATGRTTSAYSFASVKA